MRVLITGMTGFVGRHLVAHLIGEGREVVGTLLPGAGEVPPPGAMGHEVDITDADAMAELSVEEIAEIIRPCGLTPMKSKGLQGLSQIIMEQHDGQVPESFEALEAMPAVGHKTASVVMSQAFGHPAFPVDTHIHRLMYRWNFTNGRSVEQTEKDAKRLFPKELWNKLHLQIIFYGREYSPARGLDLERDHITRTIGRKSVLQEAERKRASKKRS